MREPVSIYDHASQQEVEAFIFDDVTPDHLRETLKWRPSVARAAKQIYTSGDTNVPGHYKWDWTSKEGDLAFLACTFFGIEYSGELQGIIKVDKVGHVGRLEAQAGKDLIYVDYLESAPWNVPALAQAANIPLRYGLVGINLMAATVNLSIEETFSGRVALHSLPTSESFYTKIGMRQHSRDPLKQCLMWYEFTPELALKFLNGDN